MSDIILTARSNLVAIADAVRNKIGETDELTLGEIVESINGIEVGSGGIDTSDATATTSDILIGETAYVNGQKITGTIETKSVSDLATNGATVTVPSGYYASQATKSVTLAPQAAPNISVDASGLITATATQTAGYVSAGAKSATKQLPTKAATTITPTTMEQIAVLPGYYTSGNIRVAGDSNLAADNIKSGVSIFGVSGAYEGDGIDTSDATATAEEIFSGETAYVNGEKVTGTFTVEEEISAQDDLITQIQTALQNKASAEPVLQTKTVTPSVNSQTVEPDSGYDGLSSVVVEGDANLVADNIVSGVSIFGVTGSASSGGASVATCTVQLGENGDVTFDFITIGDSGVEIVQSVSAPATIANVVCNSIAAYFAPPFMDLCDYYMEIDGQQYYPEGTECSLHVPNSPDSTVHIDVYSMNAQ